MKKLLSFAVGAALFAGIASTQQLKAQIYADFNLVRLDSVPSMPFQSIDGDGVELTANSFFDKPTSTVVNRDDGYARITLPFDYTYNGQKFRANTDPIFVSINGFIVFGNPPAIEANNSLALFTNSASYPENVVAPFWGDHIYRLPSDNATLPLGANQYQVSKIFIKKDADKVTIEWKDLNILDKTIKTSVATFQLIIYKADPATRSDQGAIEFAYGTAGKRPGQASSDEGLATVGASVGVKGWAGQPGNDADFINAFVDRDKNLQKTDKRLSANWPPSGATDKRFRFVPIIRHFVPDSWGDGDADMSRDKFGVHFGETKQNIFVNTSDVKVIMRSIATRVPLDSIAGRAAYHGDVNHNGRFVYDINLQKRMIPVKVVHENDTLGVGDLVSNIARDLRFEITEFDAALITHYMAARVPQLPWLLDTIPMYGKVEAKATAVVFGTPTKLSNGSFTMPLYLNGNLDGAIATKFDINGVIEDVSTVDVDNVLAEYDNNRLVVAGSSIFKSGEAVCYITFRVDSDELNISNLTYNDVVLENTKIDLTSDVENDDVNKMLANYPNPFAVSTSIAVNVEKSGFYTLSIYDVQGNLVKTLISSNLDAGLNSYLWDGTDNNGSRVESGMYIYRLIGDNVSVSNTMQIVK